MKDGTSNEKDPVSIVAFLRIFKADCNAYSIHKGAAMWLLNHYRNGAIEYVVKTSVLLPV